MGNRATWFVVSSSVPFDFSRFTSFFFSFFYRECLFFRGNFLLSLSSFFVDALNCDLEQAVRDVLSFYRLGDFFIDGDGEDG